MQKALSLASLGDLDGGAAGLIANAEIRKFQEDLDDRGSDGKERTVVIVLKGKMMDNGLADLHVTAKANLPARRTASTIARMKRDGMKQSRLVFQDGSPDDPDQRTLDEVNPQPCQRHDEE